MDMGHSPVECLSLGSIQIPQDRVVASSGYLAPTHLMRRRVGTRCSQGIQAAGERRWRSWGLECSLPADRSGPQDRESLDKPVLAVSRPALLNRSQVWTCLVKDNSDRSGMACSSGGLHNLGMCPEDRW